MANDISNLLNQFEFNPSEFLEILDYITTINKLFLVVEHSDSNKNPTRFRGYT